MLQQAHIPRHWHSYPHRGTHVGYVMELPWCTMLYGEADAICYNIFLFCVPPSQWIHTHTPSSGGSSSNSSSSSSSSTSSICSSCFIGWMAMSAAAIAIIFRVCFFLLQQKSSIHINAGIAHDDAQSNAYLYLYFVCVCVCGMCICMFVHTVRESFGWEWMHFAESNVLWIFSITRRSNVNRRIHSIFHWLRPTFDTYQRSQSYSSTKQLYLANSFQSNKRTNENNKTENVEQSIKNTNR